MKFRVLVFSVLLTIGAVFSFTMQANSEMARVPKVQGKYVFVCCEPTQEYEVVQNDFSVSVWKISEPGDFIYPALKKAESKGWEFDALKVDISGRFELIKFVE